MRRCFVLAVPFALWACASSSRPVEQAATRQHVVPIAGEVEIPPLNVSGADAHSDAIVEHSEPLYVFWFFGDRPIP
jgi:hypothetical protein